MRIRLSTAVLALACVLAGGAARGQEETVVVRRATDLREQPGESRVLGPLAADTAVTRLAERQGPWVRVRTSAGAVGWVHLFDLGANGSATASGSSSGGASGLLRGVTGFFNKPGAQPTTVSTSAVGIRGLGAQDLARAEPDTAAVSRMEALRVNETQARQFAREAGLAAVPVEPLPAPARPVVGTSLGAQQ